MQSLPSLDGLNWSKIRAGARTLAERQPLGEALESANEALTAPDRPHRQLGAFLLAWLRHAKLNSNTMNEWSCYA